MIANTPETPYFAVIFTSVLKSNDPEYHKMAERMIKLAANQEGFLGIESAREEIGISVSYWKDKDSISKWKKNSEHLAAKEMGINNWYNCYKTRVALVERDY